MSELQLQLLQLAQQARLKAEQQGDHWRAFADPAEVSPAQYGEPSEDQVGWWPVAQNDPLDFTGLEQGLGLTLHPSVKDFYATLWGQICRSVIPVVQPACCFYGIRAILSVCSKI